MGRPIQPVPENVFISSFFLLINLTGKPDWPFSPGIPGGPTLPSPPDFPFLPLGPGGPGGHMHEGLPGPGSSKGGGPTPASISIVFRVVIAAFSVSISLTKRSEPVHHQFCNIFRLILMIDKAK